VKSGEGNRLRRSGGSMGRVPLLLPPSCCLVGALMIDDLSVAAGRHDVMLLGDR
jgi:hypothetical protein